VYQEAASVVKVLLSVVGVSSCPAGVARRRSRGAPQPEEQPRPAC